MAQIDTIAVRLIAQRAHFFELRMPIVAKLREFITKSFQEYAQARTSKVLGPDFAIERVRKNAYPFARTLKQMQPLAKIPSVLLLTPLLALVVVSANTGKASTLVWRARQAIIR